MDTRPLTYIPPEIAFFVQLVAIIYSLTPRPSWYIPPTKPNPPKIISFVYPEHFHIFRVRPYRARMVSWRGGGPPNTYYAPILCSSVEPRVELFSLKSLASAHQLQIGTSPSLYGSNRFVTRPQRRQTWLLKNSATKSTISPRSRKWTTPTKLWQGRTDSNR